MTVRLSCVDAVRDRWDVFDGAKRIGRSLSLVAADRLAAERAYQLTNEVPVEASVAPRPVDPRR